MPDLTEVEYVEVKVVTGSIDLGDGAHLIDFGDREEWVPNRWIEDIDDDTVTMHTWKARDLGLVED